MGQVFQNLGEPHDRVHTRQGAAASRLHEGAGHTFELDIGMSAFERLDQGGSQLVSRDLVDYDADADGVFAAFHLRLVQCAGVEQNGF
jgi:hypothetical protein